MVRGPEDLVFTDQVPAPTGEGADPAELERARARAGELEAALEHASELETRTREELGRAREERREELERAQALLLDERERHERELKGLRDLLDQRERDLRTLALEMGKTQGRLEVAERHLLEARGAATRTATPEPVPSITSPSRWLPAAIFAVVAAAALGLVLREIGWMPIEVLAVGGEELESQEP